MKSEEQVVADAIAEHGSAPESPLTFIYFLQGVDGGPIKIGKADDPISRRKSVQTGNPYPLRLTRAVIARQLEEWRLHRLFADFRLEGEWFKPHPVLAALADAIPDESLSDQAVAYHAELSYDMPIAFLDHISDEFLDSHTVQHWTPERMASYFTLSGRRPLPPNPRLADGTASTPGHTDTVTFRPEPDELGWRDSSAA